MYVFGSGRRRRRGGDMMRGLDLGFNNPVVTGGVLDLCGLWWCRWGVGRGLGTVSIRLGWCYVCVSCESGFFV